MIAVERGDSWDRTASSVILAYNPGAKFDINIIPTKTFKIGKTRSDSISQEEADNAVAKLPIGREILAYIFNRDSNGIMNDKLVRYRGNYDAKDQDVINARASRVGTEALGDMGHALVSGSYIVVTDLYNIHSKTDKNGKVTWYASSKALAYRLGITPELLDDFYEKCWIYDDDNQSVRDAKIRAFNAFDIEMLPVASTTSSGSGKTAEAAMNGAMYGLIEGLENNISDWEVAVTIAARKPLRAKIGTKEGLSNGARYRAYSYSEDKNGNLKSVPRGFLRATTIADNEGMAMGESATSEFYQISGIANIDEGWTIKQSNDMKMGAMVGLRFGGICPTSLSIDLDYLLNVKTNGQMSYVLFGAGFDLKNTGYTNFNIGLGYAYGFHLTRLVELAPYLMIMDDYLSSSISLSDSDVTFLMKSALVFEPGLRAAVNVAYPLQVYGRIYADWLSLKGTYYKTYNNYVGHKSGVGFQVGVKWTF